MSVRVRGRKRKKGPLSSRCGGGRRRKNVRASFSHDVIYAQNFGTRRLKTLRLFRGKLAAECCPENFNFANKTRTFIKPNYSPFPGPILRTAAAVEAERLRGFHSPDVAETSRTRVEMIFSWKRLTKKYSLVRKLKIKTGKKYHLKL